MNTSLNIYGESVAISKTESLGETTLTYWHSQQSLLCGVTVNTQHGSKNIILNQA